MIRWANVVVLSNCMLFACMPTMMPQATNQPNSRGPVLASDHKSTEQSAAGPTDAAPSANNYPLDEFPDFSALMIGSRAEPSEGFSRGHIYRLGKRLRMEEPGGHAYFITDLDSGETYGIVEASCIRDDHPYIRAIPFYMAGMAESTVARASAGKETVDGHSCQVEDITVSSPMLADPQKMRLWEADDLQGFPIKIEFVLPRGHGPIIRYTNVVLGPQDPTLFIHPKSCQPLPQVSTKSPAAKKPPAH